MLTQRQQELIDYLRDHHRTRGLMPSTREIQQHFGFASQTAAVTHLRALERKGVLRKLAGKARALIIDEPAATGGTARRVPVYGSIPAGMPTEERQQPEGTLAVDAALLKLPAQARTFALRVRGDSMIGAHILPGDHAIFVVREPADGDIVAALIDGETTLKRFVLRDGEAFLKAENPAYPDLMPLMELTIQGVLVGLVRQGAGAV